MPQTILAIMALMIAMLLTLQQQRSSLQTQMNIIHSEVALQGTGVAEEVLNMLGSMAFDQATVDDEANSSAELTSGPPYASDLADDDIDDFDNRTLTYLRLFGADTLHFSVEVDVIYAVEGDPETPAASGAETKVKKATIIVTCTDLTNPEQIQMSRSYTCGTACNWT